MPKYRPVYTKIWKDRDFLNASKDEKLLFIYFITNESITNSGIYEIPIKTISMETGIPCPTVTQLLTNGSIKNIHYDLEHEIVFVPNARKYCPGGRPDQVEKGIFREFKQTYKTPLWKMFVGLNPQFKDIFSTVDQQLVNGCSTVHYPYSYPYPSLNNKNEQSKNDFDADKFFSIDWGNYPRKEGNKKDAKRHYKREVKSHADREKYLEKTKRYLASKDDLAFIMYGTTWMNQWRDYEIGEKIVKAEKKSNLRKQLEAIDGIGEQCIQVGNENVIDLRVEDGRAGITDEDLARIGERSG